MNSEAPVSVASTTPTLSGKLVALGGVVIACAYLANLGAGFIDIIPDNLPGIGNLDEVFFSGLLIISMHKLGIPLIPGLTSPRGMTVNQDAGSLPDAGKSNRS
jgi:hypothetical protein